ncbi:MAG TPA: hypothetical protein VHE53_02470 [Patescibacteria group bacterium]|nr:hypothetical protein [Patescibacteria group bacterium]
MVVRERASSLTLEDLQKGLERRTQLLSTEGETLVWENLTGKFGVPKGQKESKALQRKRDRILDRLDQGYDDLVARIDKLSNPTSITNNGNGHTAELATPIDLIPTESEEIANDKDEEGEPKPTEEIEEATREIEAPSPFLAKGPEEKPVPLEISQAVRLGVTIEIGDQSYIGALFINRASQRVLEEDAGIRLDSEDEENAALLIEEAAEHAIKDPSESALTLSDQLQFIRDHRKEFRQVSEDKPHLGALVNRLLSSPAPSETILNMFEAGGFVIAKTPTISEQATAVAEPAPTKQLEQPGEKTEDGKGLDSSKIFILASVINSPVIKEALRAIGHQSLSSADQERLSAIIKATPMEVRQSLLASFKTDFAKHVVFMLDTVDNIKDYERETRHDARTVLSLLPRLDHETIEKIKAKLVPQKQIAS